MPVNKTLLARAQSAVIARDFDTATRLYNEMLQESPDDIELLRQLGNIHVKNNKDSAALPIFLRIAELSPKDVDALISIGGIYRRQKKFNESIAVLERALAIGTNNPQVSYNLGFTFRQMKQYDDAIACFEDVVDQNPNDVLAFNHIGAIYAERKEHEAAIDTYLRGLKIDPNHPILQMNLAKSYETIGTYSKAVIAYAAALKAKPGWLECIDNYSKLLLKLNRVRDAYELINGALRLNAEDTKMHTRMGDVYMRQSIYPSAEKEYKEALSYDDTYIPALAGLIDSQEEQGKTEEAIQTVQKIEKLDPDNPTVIQKSASVYLSANYLSAAYEKIMQLMDSSTKDVQTLSLLGQYYISNGEWEQAEETLQKIIALEPSYSEFYRAGAKRFVQAGKPEEAEKYLQRAIAQNPHDAKALAQLGSLYEKNNQMDKAYDAFRKASAVDCNNNEAKTALMRVRTISPALGTYDAPPIMEMQNAEIRDEVIPPEISVQPATEPDFSEQTEFSEDMETQASKPVEELASRNAELIEEVDLPEEEPVIVFEPEDEPFDFADMGSGEAEPMPQTPQATVNEMPDDGLEELREDKTTDAMLFDDASMFADSPDTDEQPMPQEEPPKKEPAPQKKDNKWFAEPVDEENAEDDEEEDDIPDALSAALDKITAQADKAMLAAEDAWRAARKAADYAQAAEDAVSAAEEAASHHEESAAPQEDILPQDIESVETTEGEAHVTNDDLVDMDVPILPLPEETTEVTDNDLDTLIDVPVLSLKDSAEILADASDTEENAAPTEMTSPSFQDMVKETDEADLLKKSASLFRTLRDMTKNLSQNEQDMFQDSRMSSVLDKLITRLEAKED